MKRLGEILLERGSIAITELHTGLEACRHRGGRLGTHLLRFGFVDEHALLEALSEQLGVPPVASQVLQRAPLPLRRLLPVHVARRLQAVAFDRRDGILSIAMTSPRSPSAVEEVVGYVGLDIKPHVATEPAILAALEAIPDDEEETSDARAETRPVPSVAPSVVDQWQRLWSPGTLVASDLLHPRSRAVRAEIPPAATFPGLAPVPTGGVRQRSGPLDEEAFSALLRAAEHRDEIADILVRRCLAVVKRCCLLAVHSGKVVGWTGGGAGVVVDDLQTFEVEQETSSILSGLAGGESFSGPIPSGFVNQMILEALGDPIPTEAAVVPLPVKSRVVAFVVGDVPGGALPAGAVDGLQAAARKAGVALEILIMKKKFLA